MSAARGLVCVVGSGGREHALAHCLARQGPVVLAPGRASMARPPRAQPSRPRPSEARPGPSSRAPVAAPGDELASLCYEISVTDLAPEEIDADLFVIGPEVPLVDGLADRLRHRGRLVVGPGADGARLEGSKAYMKALVTAAGAPTPRWGAFRELDAAIGFLRRLPGPYVVKTDGLAAGKGVLVTADLDEAERDVADKLSGAAFGVAGRVVVIEEAIAGMECSLLVCCDGTRAEPLPPARDYKRLRDGDRGPNTGGMGACSPVPDVPDGFVSEAMESIIHPTLHELARRGIDYRGVLYAGLMATEEGPKLLEYNVRLGDPEAEVVLPRLDGDVLELFHSMASGRLRAAPRERDEAAVCVVAAAEGYPDAPVAGGAITGCDRAGSLDGVTVFHAGTARGAERTSDVEPELSVAGGRVLVVTALGKDLGSARERAYEAMGEISFPGMQFRSDIAADL